MRLKWVYYFNSNNKKNILKENEKIAALYCVKSVKQEIDI